jgi:uncharacterized protein YlaI
MIRNYCNKRTCYLCENISQEGVLTHNNYVYKFICKECKNKLDSRIKKGTIGAIFV